MSDVYEVEVYVYDDEDDDWYDEAEEWYTLEDFKKCYELDNGVLSGRRFDFKKNGELHREDGPAKISYGDNGFIWIQEWYLNGELHREDGPAEIWYNSDGRVDEECYYLNGENCTIVEFANHLGVDHYKSETEEVYLKDKKLHREDGPARIQYRNNGSVKGEEWYLNGKQHREDGPATIQYRNNGSVKGEKWYLNGERLSKNAFKKRFSKSQV